MSDYLETKGTERSRLSCLNFVAKSQRMILRYCIVFRMFELVTGLITILYLFGFC